MRAGVNDISAFDARVFPLAVAVGATYLPASDKEFLMPLPTVHEALIYLMVVTSASDRDMAHLELGSIGEVVRTWPVFQDFDKNKLLDVAQDCQVLLTPDDGLEQVLELAHRVIPTRLRDTAYAAVFEVAAADLEMRLEEARILQRVREHLEIDALSVAAIEMANKARIRTLT